MIYWKKIASSLFLLSALFLYAPFAHADIGVTASGTITGLDGFWTPGPLGSYSVVPQKAAYPTEPTYSGPGQDAILEGCSGTPCTRPSTYDFANAISGFTSITTQDYTLLVYDIHATLSTGSATLANADHYVSLHYNGSVWSLLAASPINSTSTRIVSFTPEEGTTTSNNVTFALHVYIAPSDLSGVLGVQMFYQNVDQNQLLSNIPGVDQGSHIFINAAATSSGDLYFTATTTLPDGNYRVEAKIERSIASVVLDPFSSINSDQNHQFIVNEESYIGHLTQNGFREYQAILGSTTATSTAAAAQKCNPLSFDMSLCLAYLFIPGGPQLDTTVTSFQEGVVTRIPWGYFYRVYQILNTTSTSSLPSFTVDIPIGPPSNIATTSLSFDMGDMMSGGGTLVDSLHDYWGHSLRDIAEPVVQLVVALAVIFTIFADVTGSHNHGGDSEPRDKKRSLW